MAIIKTLIRSLIRRNPNPRSNLDTSSFVLRLTSSHSRLLPHFPQFLPLTGPRILSSPPWMLSPSTTPLYLRGKHAAFPGDLLPVRSVAVELGFKGGAAAVVSGGQIEGVRVAEDVNEDGFLNLPNLISISRAVSGPFIGWMIMNEWYFPAFCGLAISGATDWLDGFLARKMGINSVFGSYLDPLADKILIGCVALAMVKQDLLHPALVGLVVFRDVALVTGAVYKRASGLGWKWKSWSDFVNLDSTHREMVEPLLISKVYFSDFNEQKLFPGQGQYSLPTAISCCCSSSTRIRHRRNPVVHKILELVGSFNNNSILSSLWSSTSF